MCSKTMWKSKKKRERNLNVNKKGVKLWCINTMRNYKAITKSEGDFVVLTRRDVHTVLLKSSILDGLYYRSFKV